MPLQDFSSLENTFSANISSAGAIDSQSGNWLSSVSKSSTGKYVLTFASSFFSVKPGISATVNRSSSNAATATVDGSATFDSSQVTIIVDDASNTNIDENFTVIATRQGGDYRQAPQPTAAVIKPAVAIGKVEASQGTNGGSSSGDSFHQRKFASWSGETWFMSGFDGTMGVDGTTDQFDLDPGTYKVAGNTISYQADQCFSVMDSTDNSVVINGTHNYASDGEAVTSDNPFAGTFTITEKKTFKIWTYIFSAETNTGLGVAANESGWNEVFGQVTIEKLK